jgi:hypothetical protein
MRTLLLASLPLVVAVTACSDDDEHRNAAAAVAAGFRPPTVLARADFGMDLDKRFGKLDLNGDSALERNEWPPRYADRIAELDEDKDGKVTNGEFFETLMARFDAADTNQDQVLTSDERAAADIPHDRPGNSIDADDIPSGMGAAASNGAAAP